MGALIDLLNQLWIDDNTELFGILVLLVQHGDALADGLVVFDVLDALDKVADVELFLELKVKDGSIVQKFHIDVRAVLFDLVVDAVKCTEFIRRHSVMQIILSVLDRLEHGITSANGALRDIAILVLVDPGLGGAELAPELVGVFTVELDIPEIEAGVVALFAGAMRCLDTCLDEGAGFWVGGQVEGRVYASVSQLEIDTELHKALEDLDLRVGRGLMDAVVAVDIN